MNAWRDGLLPVRDASPRGTPTDGPEPVPPKIPSARFRLPTATLPFPKFHAFGIETLRPLHEAAAISRQFRGSAPFTHWKPTENETYPLPIIKIPLEPAPGSRYLGHRLRRRRGRARRFTLGNFWSHQDEPL